MTNQIPVSKVFALVDDDDYEELSSHKWCLSDGYAIRTDYSGEKQKNIRMHRYIMGCKEGFEVDHINGNRLDNRKENLRICTRSENSRNRKPHKNSTHGYKGVCFDRKKNSYMARITRKGKYVYLGKYKTPKEAAEAYDRAVKLYFGDFARLNFKESNDNKS